MTPSTAPKWDSTPQNQPAAKVAVAYTSGAATSMGGGTPFAFISPSPPSGRHPLKIATDTSIIEPSDNNKCLYFMINLIVQTIVKKVKKAEGVNYCIFLRSTITTTAKVMLITPTKKSR